MAIYCDLQVTVAAEGVPGNVAPFALAVTADTTGGLTDEELQIEKIKISHSKKCVK